MLTKSKLKPKKVRINLDLNQIIIINYDYDIDLKNCINTLNYKIDDIIIIKHQPVINYLTLPTPKKNTLLNFFNISRYLLSK